MVQFMGQDANAPAFKIVGRTPAAGARVSMGAAATPVELQRVTTAEQLGFVGPSGLTAGQRTRNFADLKFEKETAKLGEVGAPLRERVSNQTANLIQQFDAMVDRTEPMLVEPKRHWPSS
jgi:hypothetical protein